MPTDIISNNTTGTLGGVKDTYGYLASPNTNFGSSTTFQVQNNATDRGFIWIEWPLPSGRTDATVSAVRLKLKINATSTDWVGNGQFIDLVELLRAFGELTATYNKWDGTNNWATAGGTGTGDIGTTTLASLQPDTAGGTVYTLTGANLTALVQAAYTAGQTVLRMALRPRNLAPSSGSYAVFESSNSTDGNRPALEVDYTATPPITATLNGALDTITGNLVVGPGAITATLSGSLDSITGNVTVGGTTGRLTSQLPLRDAARVVLANRSDVAVHVLGKPGLNSVVLLGSQSIASGIWTAAGPFTPGTRYNVVYEVGGEPIGCEIITATAP